MPQKSAIQSPDDGTNPANSPAGSGRPIVLRPTPLSFLSNVIVSMLLTLASIYHSLQSNTALGAILMGVALIIMAKPLYVIFSHEYRIYEDRVSVKNGLIATKETVLPREKIITRNVIYRTVIGRLLDYGDVEFSSAASDKAEVTFSNVMRPNEIAEYVGGKSSNKTS